jgi:hypothetical protein
MKQQRRQQHVEDPAQHTAEGKPNIKLRQVLRTGPVCRKLTVTHQRRKEKSTRGER